ncbi:enoyl-CoA hydratase/isomerase family protein [Seohaeicola zhoushanensis]|uniref:Crotonase n=1 Tax=Seohaeicola zhoushanensis TaxID=1569283 RepID=A0A8J3H1Y7_9RHOB|nr:enoyl-CoA hydratase/isomerase family protein [Seohaeicola zhoushanensis]GHF66978.1 crotonase [Seohaeicola zhoushanensis]
MSDAPILLEHDGPVSWIVLNRPDAANALSVELLEAFSDTLDTLRTEGGPVVGLRANGKGFCSGMDLAKYGGDAVAGPMGDVARLQTNLGRWMAMWDHPKPVIAAVHGYCMGVGAQMIGFADITVVSDDVRIGEPGLPIGGGYVAPAWVSHVGVKRAKEFSFLPGNHIDGPTAVAWGLVNHCVSAGRLLDVVRELAARIATVPPEVLRGKKASINRAAEAQGFRTALAGISESDALLHFEPSVLAIRERMKRDGLKSVLAEFRGRSSNEIAGGE